MRENAYTGEMLTPNGHLRKHRKSTFPRQVKSSSLAATGTRMATQLDLAEGNGCGSLGVVA
jgi:hypothetical protein